MSDGWGNRLWHTRSQCFIGGQWEPMWGRAGNRRAGKHTHTQTYTSSWVPLPFLPPDAEAIGTISCPLSPSLRTAPSFLDTFCSLEPPESPPLCNQLPHLNRRHLTAASTHSHTKQLSLIHQQLTGHDAHSGDLLVRPHLLAFYQRRWERLSGAPGRHPGSPWVKAIDQRTAKYYKYPACQYL